VKVAYLAPESAIAGGQRVIFQQAEGLAKTGETVSVVSPSPRPDWFRLEAAGWEESEFDRSRVLAEADVRVATFWTTVAPAVAGARVPVYHLCQGYEADLSFYAALSDEIRAAYRAPTRKLAVAPHVAERLVEEGYGPVVLVGQTFDAREFPPARDRRFDAATPTILLVGTYEADVKGIRETLEALSALRSTGARFRLRRISTTAPAAEEIALGLADSHDRNLKPADMAAAYRSADLLIGPCHPEEGFGLPVLEALSTGLPVLLSDTPGHRDIAREAAEYFACGDAASLASALARLLPDASRRRELSGHGPLEASRFRTANVVDRLVEEFSAALSRSATVS